jgi:catechol 2,3-dioxygenase-like lactoylglutathione lyase family enzyme
MSLAQIVIPTADLDSSRAWYESNFGMALVFAAPNVVALGLDGMRYLLTLGEAPVQGERGVLLYFTSADIGADYARLAGSGALAPHCVARMAGEEIFITVVHDPAGHPIGLYQAVPVAAGG